MAKGGYAKAVGSAMPKAAPPISFVQVDRGTAYSRHCPACEAQGLIQIHNVYDVSKLDPKNPSGVDSIGSAPVGWLCIGCFMRSGMTAGIYMPEQLARKSPAERAEFEGRMKAAWEEMQKAERKRLEETEGQRAEGEGAPEGSGVPAGAGDGEVVETLLDTLGGE